MQVSLIIDISAIAVSIFFFALGSFFDLRTGEVDDKVWLVYGPVGLALTIARLLLDSSNLVVTLVSIGITTGFSFGLFYFGLFGGADCKAIICLGLTQPLPPTSFQPFLGYVHPIFPLVVVITGFICSSLVGVWFGVTNLSRYLGRKDHMFQGLERESPWRKALAFVLGYRAEISKLVSTFYLYPMEEVVRDATGAHRSLKLFMDAETDRDAVASEFSKSLAGLGYGGKVWVTPGLPMLLFILVGLGLTLALGDIVFSTVFILGRG